MRRLFPREKPRKKNKVQEADKLSFSLLGRSPFNPFFKKEKIVSRNYFSLLITKSAISKRILFHLLSLKISNDFLALFT